MNYKNKSTRALTLLPLAASLLLTTGNSAADDDQPTIAKDSVQVTAFTVSVFHKDFDKWGWVPKIEFRINGPVGSGSQLYATFNIPGGAPVKFDCNTQETQKGRWSKTECGGADIPEEKASLYTGPVSFAIRMRNELAGSDGTLFTGKMKVGKVHSNEHGPKAAKKFVYFVDDDWNLPIGYVFLVPDDIRGWDYPVFHVAFWVRGDPVNFDPHLFFQGKEVGKMFFKGDEVGKPGCGSEIENGTTHFVDDAVPEKAKWSRINCTFNNVRGVDKTGQPVGMFGPLYLLSANPGDYEFKVLWKNHLARSIKFTVGADGKFDNGIGTSNKLGNNRSIFPVQIIGEEDGKWNRAAWKSEAFYGNPLTGFTALP